MYRNATLATLLATAATLSGCSSLPSSGPTAGTIVRQERDQASMIGFKIVDINASGLPLTVSADTSGARALASLARPGRVDLIGPGDVLQVNIYEVGVTLFGNGGTALGGGTGDIGTGAQAQTINGVTVERDGSIRLPYIGRLAVAGKTTADVQRLVVRGLSGKSQVPQALVSVVRDVTNVAYVSGVVARPGRFQLTLAGERLLDAIANSGGTGTADGPQSTIVQFTRDGRTVEAYLRDIDAGSAADLVLVPGDRINLIRRPLTFLVFGATGRVSQVPFDTSNVSLAEALARAGGPDDSRADPTAIFVFRDVRGGAMPGVPGASAAPAGTTLVPPEPGAPADAPMIYRLDMTKPSSYFLAQRFAMRDKDVLFVANARMNQTRKLVEIVNLLFSPVFAIRQVAN